ncbi:MAG: hypothetical protein AAF657_14400 [Acidobacteriota bacterium]
MNRSVWNASAIGALVICVLTAALWPTTLAASPRQSYRAGLAAVAAEDWAAAAQHMREAIAADDEAGRRIRVHGLRRESYLPYFYLGLALYRLGDCPGAVDVWHMSLHQGAILEHAEEQARLMEGLENCTREPAGPGAASRRYGSMGT